jgi:hypothetical protein
MAVTFNSTFSRANGVAETTGGFPLVDLGIDPDRFVAQLLIK